MTTCQITISNDTMTLGQDATDDDLHRYGKQLAAELSEEFECDVYYSLASCLRSSVKCADSEIESAVEARLHEIERGDEWIEVLNRAE